MDDQEEMEEGAGLTNDELLALEAELLNDDGPYDDSDSDGADAEMEMLAAKLKTALHESERDLSSGSDNILSTFPGFDSFSKSSGVMSDALKVYTENINVIQNMDVTVTVRGDGPSVKSLGEGESSQKITSMVVDNLSARDMFDLAISTAARGAISFCISNVEHRHEKDIEDAHKKMLKAVEAERIAREAEIKRKEESEMQQQAERSRKQLEARNEAREKRRLNDQRVKERLEEIERQAQEEHDSKKRQLEEDQRKRREKRRQIAETEEKRWSLTSRAVGFVQSRIRGLIGRKEAVKKKEEKRIHRDERVRKGSKSINILVFRHLMHSSFGVWKRIVEKMRNLADLQR